MPNVFFVADLHLGHVGVTKFLGKDGVSKLRPWDSIEEMDEAIIENWNKVVKPGDKVYNLGDVVINRKHLHKLGRLAGKQVLVKGNHDIFKLEDYVPFFYDIRAYHVIDNLICSHIPVHAGSKSRFKGNVHGHLHDRVVLDGTKVDPFYKCVSMELINFTPIALEEVQKHFKGN